MASPDFDVIKDIPGYKVILKAVLKHQIQQLVEQLAANTDEESIILTASVADGTLSHLGSDSAKGFLDDHDDVKSQFLGYCLKSHHKRKQEQEREEALKKAQQEAAANFAPDMGYMPRPRGPRFSPRQPFRTPPGMRHQPYPVTRPIRASPVRMPSRSPSFSSPSKGGGDGPVIKQEPSDTDETSNQSAGVTSDPSSPSQIKDNNDDGKSESSTPTIPVEAGSEGLSLGADLSNLIDADNQSANPSSSDNPDSNVKLEAISESEMELEITGVEPGRTVEPQDWGANMSGYDPMGATGSPGDMAAAHQGYRDVKSEYPEVMGDIKLEDDGQILDTCSVKVENEDYFEPPDMPEASSLLFPNADATCFLSPFAETSRSLLPNIETTRSLSPNIEITRTLSPSSEASRSVSPNPEARTTWHNTPDISSLKHVPELIPTQEGSKTKRPPCKKCFICQTVSQKRRLTRYWCERCHTPLCLVPCFEEYHTKDKYPGV